MGGVSFRALKHAARQLSDRYRQDGLHYATSDIRSQLDALAYAVTRMPATLATTRVVLRELQSWCTDTEIRSVLDLGAGPATTLWAAAAELSGLSSATVVEPNPYMMALGRQLLVETSVATRVETVWHAGGLPDTFDEGTHDLVVAGYLLTELDPGDRAQVVDQAWRAGRHAVVVILPGSAPGFQILLEARRQLLDLGATIIAPCPHQRACPLGDDDWCHFGVRLNRSSLHRRLKDGKQPYEDEKYSYVVAVHGRAVPAAARVIRRPLMHDRRVILKLCSADGIRDEQVTRSQGDTYRRARKIGWGDAW